MSGIFSNIYLFYMTSTTLFLSSKVTVTFPPPVI